MSVYSEALQFGLDLIFFGPLFETSVKCSPPALFSNALEFAFVSKLSDFPEFVGTVTEFSLVTRKGVLEFLRYE